MALRDHLRSDQDDAVGSREPVERGPQRSGLGGRVRVEPVALELRDVLRELGSSSSVPAPSRTSSPDPQAGQLSGTRSGGRSGGTGAARRHACRRHVTLAASAVTRRHAVKCRSDAAPVQEEDRLAAPSAIRPARAAAARRADSRTPGGGRRCGRGASARRSPPSSSRSRRAQLSGRGVALPNTATAPSLAARSPRRFSRHSADRIRACTRDRAPRRGRSARACARARTGPSAHRRRCGYHRRRYARARRASLPPSARSAGCDDLTEARPEARERLRRQRDLGDEDDRRVRARARRARLEVDLGLSAARGPVEEEDGRRPPRAPPTSASPRASLLGGSVRAHRPRRPSPPAPRTSAVRLAASARPARRARGPLRAWCRSNPRARARGRRAPAAPTRRRARPPPR